MTSREFRSNAESVKDSENESSGAGTTTFEQIALLQIARALNGGNDEIDLVALLGGDSRQHNNEHPRNTNYDHDSNILKSNKKKNSEQQVDEKTYNKSSTYVVVNPNEIIEMLSSIPTTRPVEIYDERVGKVTTSYGYK